MLPESGGLAHAVVEETEYQERGGGQVELLVMDAIIAVVHLPLPHRYDGSTSFRSSYAPLRPPGLSLWERQPLDEEVSASLPAVEGEAWREQDHSFYQLLLAQRAMASFLSHSMLVL